MAFRPASSMTTQRTAGDEKESAFHDGGKAVSYLSPCRSIDHSIRTKESCLLLAAGSNGKEEETVIGKGPASRSRRHYKRSSDQCLSCSYLLLYPTARGCRQVGGEWLIEKLTVGVVRADGTRSPTECADPGGVWPVPRRRRRSERPHGERISLSLSARVRGPSGGSRPAPPQLQSRVHTATACLLASEGTTWSWSLGRIIHRSS
jgi:hypothetical protein